MKLLRYGTSGQEKPAVLAADGKIHDLSGTHHGYCRGIPAAGVD